MRQSQRWRRSVIGAWCCRWLKILSIVVSICTFCVLLWMYRPVNMIDQDSIRKIYEQLYLQPSEDEEKPHLPLLLINGTQTRLLSAYLESRVADMTVRVIAVVLRSMPMIYHCTLRCRGRHYTSIGQAYIHTDHFGFNYGTGDIVCSVPSGCDTPTHIAVRSPITANENANEEEFLKVLNRKVRTDSFPHTFTVCLTMTFDFSNVLQLVQNMEMLQLLGVSKVVVYKSSCSAEVQGVLEYYTLKGLMEVIPWEISNFLTVSESWMPGKDPVDLPYYGQMTVFTDCLHRNMFQSKYLAMHDLDELIIPRLQNSWDTLLPLLEQTNSSASCYTFQNCVFRTNVKLPPPPGQQRKGSWQDVSGVNILDHLYHEPFNLDIQKYRVIFNPRLVTAITLHGVLQANTQCVVVNTDIARLHHTSPPVLTELKDDQLIYDGRILDYSSRLTRAVNTVFVETGMLLRDSF